MQVAMGSSTLAHCCMNIVKLSGSSCDMSDVCVRSYSHKEASHVSDLGKMRCKVAVTNQ